MIIPKINNLSSLLLFDFISIKEIKNKKLYCVFIVVFSLKLKVKHKL
jgi:hypothetical protein